MMPIVRMMRDWSASHVGIPSVFVNDKSNSMLVFVFSVTEKEFVAF